MCHLSLLNVGVGAAHLFWFTDYARTFFRSLEGRLPVLLASENGVKFSYFNPFDVRLRDIRGLYIDLSFIDDSRKRKGRLIVCANRHAESIGFLTRSVGDVDDPWTGAPACE
jgi:hypothetical protein